jgi:hypothetical protein
MLSLSGIIGPIIAVIIYSIWPGYAPIMFFAMAMSFLAYGLFWQYNRKHRDQFIEDSGNEIV